MRGAAMGRWSLGVAFVLLCAGCVSHRQTAADLQEALAWFPPAGEGEAWPRASSPPPALPAGPVAIVIAWVPAEAPRGEALIRVSKTARERWLASLRGGIARSARASRVETAPPELFDEGITLKGVRAVAEEHGAQLVVLLAIEVDRKRHNVLDPGTGAPGEGSRVRNVMEVVSMARVLGVTAAGEPVLSGRKMGYDTASDHARSMDEVEEVATRVAIKEIADLVDSRLKQFESGRNRTR
jgi:hypothetical protein